MDAYMYRAAFLCRQCAVAKMAELDQTATGADDSDHYPQGPYPDGGGEADCPNHCDGCGVFLENPLTTEGVAWVREIVSERYPVPRPLHETWRAFYRDVLQ